MVLAALCRCDECFQELNSSFEIVFFEILEGEHEASPILMWMFFGIDNAAKSDGGFSLAIQLEEAFGLLGHRAKA